MKGGFCIKYIKFSTSRVTRRAFGATNNKIINELCRANWSVVTLARLRDLQIRQRWSEGAFSIIYVEISVHELCTVWRRSKLKNKIWHSGHNRHIALLKRTQKQVKMGYSVSIYKTLWNNSCSFSRDFVHGTRWTNLPFCKFVSVINDVTLLWTTTVLSDKLDISLRPSKSTGQTQLDILRDVIVQTFLFVIRPVSQVLQVGTKIS